MLWIAALTLTLATPPAPATLTGRVTDAVSSAAVHGASVSLPDLDRTVTTDSSGVYLFTEVPAGPHHVTVRRLGYAARSLHALVPRTGSLTLHVTLEPRPLELAEVAVEAPLAVRGLEPDIAGTYPDRGLSRDAVTQHPLLAEPDLFRALEGAEVVVRPEISGGVFIRGGASDQTGYLIDGIPVFSPYHTAGLSTAWNPDAFASVRLWSVSQPPGAGHALSGSVEGTTRSPGDRFRMQAGVSSTQARLTVDGPLGGDVGYVLAGRIGLHDQIAPDDESAHLGGNSGDWLAKLEAPLLGGRARILGLGNRDDIDAAIAPDDPRDAPRNRFEWDGRTIGGGWTRRVDALTTRLSAWSANGDAGANWADSSANVALDASRRDAGVVAGLDHETGATRSGFELRWERSRTAYAIASDSTAGPDWSLGGTTSIVTATARHARPLVAHTALAVDLSIAFANGASYFGPHAQLTWEPSARLAVTATGFRTHQFAQSLRNAESIVGSIFPVDVFLGSSVDGIPVAHSDQVVTAVDLHPFAGTRIAVQGWARRSDDLLLVAPADGEPFSTGRFAIGSSTGHGAGLDFALAGSRYGMLVAYGWQEVTMEADGTRYVPETGTRHQLQAGVTVFPTATTSVRLGAVGAFGRRSTRIPGAFDWASCNLVDEGCEFAGSPHYGDEPLGGARLPDLVRLDLGVRQHWDFAAGGRSGQIAVYGTVSNLLGRRNVLTYARDPATGQSIDVLLRPAGLLVVGMDASF